MSALDTGSALIDVDPCRDEGWLQLSSSVGSLFASPPWLRAVRDAFGVHLLARMRTDDGVPTVGLPFAELDDPSGRRRSTLPFCDYSDLLVAEHAGADWSIVTDLIDSRLPFSMRLRDRCDRPVPDALTSGTAFAWHEVDLCRALDQIWDHLHANARQGIRRAGREGVTVDVEHGERVVDEFRRLHVGVRRRKYGMLAQPPAFFESIAGEFGDDLAVIGARLNGELVAGILLLRWRDVAYYKFNASTSDGTRTHANDLCMWEAIRFAREQWGAISLDLGLSDLDQPGLLRYKAKYAPVLGGLTSHSNAAAAFAGPRSREFRGLLNPIASIVLAEGVPDHVGVGVSAKVYRYFC